MHLSDLHRSEIDPITNDELVSALVADRDRYCRESPVIRPPDALVVSGDLIQGIRLGTADSALRLRDQYATAEALLVDLVERFLDGDRSRLLMIPGNHDVDWVTAHSAMALVPGSEMPSDLAGELSRVESEYRWDWKNRELYRIVDRHLYEQRLAAFWGFFERFYCDVPGLLRVEAPSRANLWSLHGGRIGVAAFDSCYGNDCFAYHGWIPPAVVARAHLDLTSPQQAFELLVAVWHHNIEGPPYRSDYMDREIVHGMIGRGFRLGLFGHQHRPEAAPHQIYLTERETMVIVGAGSLCAGPRELPPGARRSYNIIEISDDLRRARIHVREAAVANLFARSPRAAFNGRSWADLEWTAPADLLDRPENIAARRLRASLQAAETALREGRTEDVMNILRPLLATLPLFGRQLFVQAATAAKDTTALVAVLSPPRSIAELVNLVMALISDGNFGRARQAVTAYGVGVGMPDAHCREMLARIDAEESMRS